MNDTVPEKVALLKYAEPVDVKSCKSPEEE